MGMLRNAAIIGLIAYASPVHDQGRLEAGAAAREAAAIMGLAEPSLAREAFGALARADQRTLADAAAALAALEALRAKAAPAPAREGSATPRS
jgi:hypothetical protein